MAKLKDLVDAQGLDLTGKRVKIELVDPDEGLLEPRLRGAPFQKIAPLGKNSMNTFTIMANLSKPEQRFLAMLTETIIFPQYISELSFNGLTKSQKANWNTAYKKLEGKDLVRRIKQGKYLINPQLIIPGQVEVERSARELWKNLK